MININGKAWNRLKLKDIEKFLNNIDDDETFFVEYKTENIRNAQITKEIAAFANSFGGYIFLGVDDSKNIVGCSIGKWSELKINTIVCNGISPTPKFEIKKFNLNNSKKLFVIKVEEGVMPPYVTSEGRIYQRVSSSSDPIKDANTLNNLYLKKQDNKKVIEDKIYIKEISGEIPNNLCGYIDFGFSLVTKNKEKTIKQIENANIEKICKILKAYHIKYSISKIGYSLCFSMGTPSMSRGKEAMLTTSGLSNFMEILPDGSFRCRVIIVSEEKSSIGNITSITYIHSLFAEIYESIFEESISKNFIEAYKYEKLTVLKQFQPKIVVSGSPDIVKRYDEYYSNHLSKYGNNIVINNNRVPMSGFFRIDKYLFESNKIKFNSKNLYSELFYTSYGLLGYIDGLPPKKEEK